MPKNAQCTHMGTVHHAVTDKHGCEECLKIGARWVHLRLCMECGKVGCCDDSPNRHATAHFHESRHPIVRSIEPGEDWGWCYVDELFFEPAPPVSGA